MRLDLADFVFDPIITIDQELDILSWNNAANILFGIKPIEAVGKRFFSIFQNIESELKYYLIERVFNEKGDLEIPNIKLQLPKSNKSINFKIRLAYKQTEDTQPVCVIILKKISHHQFDQEYFQLIHSVVQNTRDAILITSADLCEIQNGPKIIYANPAFYEMTGYSEKEILGKTPRILQGPKTSEESRKLIRKALDNWEPIQIELLNYKKDGSEFWIELSIVPVVNEEGWYTYWIAIQRETTERRELEDQLKLNNLNLEKLVFDRTREIEKIYKKKSEEEVGHLKTKAEEGEEQLSFTINQLELKKQKLLVQEMQITEKALFIKKIKGQLEAIVNERENPKEITRVIRFIERESVEEEDWKNFALHFEELHRGFFDKLDKICETPLTLLNKKHCAFIKLGLSKNEVASILHIEPTSVEMARYRIKKQLNISSDENLFQILQNL